jgi:hypothetical protein
MAVGVTLTVAAPASSAPGTGSSFGADVGVAWPVGAIGSPTATSASHAGQTAARRCRSTARKRLARIRNGSLAERARPAARRRVRVKLRRCLRAARRDDAQEPPASAEPPSTGQPMPQPGAPPGTPPPSPPPSLPSFVGVTASDSDGFRLTLSRPAVAAGNVTIELRNTDKGPHDLWIEPDGGGPAVAKFDEADPGAVARKQVVLPKGEWYLYCTLPGHAAEGMSARVRAE